MAEIFSSVTDAVSSYKEGSEAPVLDDNDFEGEEDQGQDAPETGSQARDDRSQDQPAEQQGDDGQDDLDRLLNDIEPDVEDVDAGQGDQTAQPQAATDDLIYRFADGTTAKVSDLAKTHSEITTHRTRMAEDRQKFDQVVGQLRQQYEAVQGQMQMAAEVLQATMPQEPDIGMLSVDPNGYHILKAAFDRQQAMLNQIYGTYQQNQQEMQTRYQTDMQTFRRTEAEKLVERDPRFGRDDFWAQFQNDMFSYGPRVYGYSAEELRNGMMDHRQFEVLRDAIEFQKIKAAIRARKGAAKHAQARVEQPRNQVNGQYIPRPTQGRVMTGQNTRGRVDQKTLQRQQAQKRFDKNPTLRNAVDLID